MSFIDELKRRNVIRVAAFYLVASWFVLQVADILFDAFELPAWSMRLLVVILAIGLVPALVFSWVYELTPDGLKREVDVAVSAARRGTGKKMNVAISVLLALAAGMVAVDRLTPDSTMRRDAAMETSTVISDTSVAVMPFVNISESSGDAYFADGLSEELLNILAGIPELQVSARTSSFALRDKDLDVRAIGSQLNVANVLEGSVRKAGSDLRITVQLISTQSGFELWSATFDRTLDHIFEVQNEIAVETARALAVSLIGETATIRQTTPEAYALYLQGLFEYRRASSDGYANTVEILTQMLEQDPEYVPAWTVLSSTYSNLSLTEQLPFREGQELALQAVTKALEIDPSYAFALSARAWLAMTYEADYVTSAQYFKLALRYSPGDPIILGNAAVLARSLGQLDRAIAMTRVSVKRNPVSPVGHVNLADQLMRVGKTDEAIAAAQRARELAPGSLTAKANLGLAYVLAGEPENAIEVAELFDPASFYYVYLMALAFPGVGAVAEADQSVQLMIDEHAESRAFYIATVYGWRNDVEQAFVWLDKALSENQRMLGIRTDPLLESLWSDARWDPLLARIGLSDAQIGDIQL